jgi:putative Holliday junction resolvase
LVAVKAAAIDLGAVRVGLAVSDDLGWLAHPRPHLDGRSPGKLLGTLSDLARAEGIEVFVVGLPRPLHGREGAAARRAREFARQLASQSGVRVELLDEWLTTRTATERLREGGTSARAARSRVDSAAAAVLLQAWIDGRRESGSR